MTRRETSVTGRHQLEMAGRSIRPAAGAVLLGQFSPSPRVRRSGFISPERGWWPGRESERSWSGPRTHPGHRGPGPPHLPEPCGCEGAEGRGVLGAGGCRSPCRGYPSDDHPPAWREAVAGLSGGAGLSVRGVSWANRGRFFRGPQPQPPRLPRPRDSTFNRRLKSTKCDESGLATIRAMCEGGVPRWR